MTFILRSGVALFLGAFFYLCGCATFGTFNATTKAILTTCGTTAAEAEAAQLYATVVAIVEKQPLTWQEQLTALEGNSKTGVLCALQQIANGAPGPTPTAQLAAFGPHPQMLFNLPSAKASANAKMYLANH